jgi:NADH pyrophosphatase NudC (nudix superfamily)
MLIRNGRLHPVLGPIWILSLCGSTAEPGNRVDQQHRLQSARGLVSAPTAASGAVARYETDAELLLAFRAPIGFKPGDLITTGMNEKRTVRLCRVLNRVTYPRRASALSRSVHKGIHYGQDDQESVD